ncbi:hypothetical protein JTB14_014193 [Gonioctena quinquepunctata]|nr:hypothetical protein JTB14_014193 [Gonioctena quinquepunctata]
MNAEGCATADTNSLSNTPTNNLIRERDIPDGIVNTEKRGYPKDLKKNPKRKLNLHVYKISLGVSHSMWKALKKAMTFKSLLVMSTSIS